MSRSGIQVSVPETANGPIDWAHLDRATLGDAGLAREVLGLFDTQAVTVAAEVRDLPPHTAMLAHGLKGSARGIGAWKVADAAQKLEAAIAGAADPSSAATMLVAEISTVRQTIADHLRSV